MFTQGFCVESLPPLVRCHLRYAPCLRSGGRIAIHAQSSSYNGTVSACGAAGLSSSYSAGGAGTVYFNVGVANRTLIIDNCGNAGQSSLLAEAGRQLYEFEIVRVQNAGVLSAAKPSAAPTDRAAVVIKQLIGDTSGRMYAANNTDVAILGLTGTWARSRSRRFGLAGRREHVW